MKGLKALTSKNGTSSYLPKSAQTDIQTGFIRAGAKREILKVYAQGECFERRRHCKLGGSKGILSHIILKFRISQMPFPNISDGHFNK